VWHILALSFVVGIAQAFGAPAYQSLLPSLVPREHLPDAIAMNSIQFNVARLVGPAVGGLTLSTLGAAWCFGLNGLSYLAVIATLLLISVRHQPAPPGGTVHESMKEGLRFIRRQKGLVSLILIAFVCTFLGIPIVVFLPVFAKDVFGGAEGTYTLLLTVEAAGAITGALLVAARGKRGGLGRDAKLSLLGLGVFMSAFALAPRIEAALGFLFFAGMALIACFSLLSSLVQMIATDEMRGRVMSIYNIAFRGGMPIGSLVIGEIVRRSGAPPVVAVNGALLAAIAVYLLLFRKDLSDL
jgi:predicted MFS family arabinose efflux permease